MELINATVSAIKLVKEVRKRCTKYNLTETMCSMIELVLIMLATMYDLCDEEILSLMKTDWNLYEFVSGLIQALSSDMKFGGYAAYRDDYRKEIKVLINSSIYSFDLK